MSANAQQLTQIAAEVSSCTRCPLAKTRCKAVPGEGNHEALVMFIGEAPGRNEDQQGRPFVGDAGRLLDRLLQAIDLPREEVYIANVVKCRPPNNQDPTPVEVEACKSYLDRQIATINPRLIVTLGRISMARFFPGKLISQIHGQYKIESGRIVLPMYHPAAALRDLRGPTMAKFKEDGLMIPELIEKAKELARTEIWGLGYAEPEENTRPALKVAETIEPLPMVKSPVIQPTLQPAVETRPGEVTPLERVVLPELANNRNGNGRAKTTESVKPEPILEATAEELSDGTLLAENSGSSVEVVAESNENETKNVKQKRSRQRVAKNMIENAAADSGETTPVEAMEDMTETRPLAKASSGKRKKKDNGVVVEQLTLF